MGVPGFEPGTSALSELRSSQLSYTPDAVIVFLSAFLVLRTTQKHKSQTDRGLALFQQRLVWRELPFVRVDLNQVRGVGGHRRPLALIARKS